MRWMTIQKGQAFTIWMAGVRHGDGGAHRDVDAAYWRDAEVAFEIWWGKMTRTALRDRASTPKRKRRIGPRF